MEDDDENRTIRTMKSQFSRNWVSSTRPSKQRKYAHEAPLHLKHKFLNATLSKELRKQHGKRSVPLRKGDEVLVMRGKFAKQTAKVLDIDLKNSRVTLENISRQKKDGNKLAVIFHPSSLMIKSLSLDDKMRLKTNTNKEKKQNASNKI